jgi:hypothetical protein
VFRRRRLAPDLEGPLAGLRAVVSQIDEAKDVMTATVPTTRLPGRPLADALPELEEHLRLAGALMEAWRHPALDEEWLACRDALAESLRRAAELRSEAPALGGFEGLIWGVLAPLDAFEDAAERFRTLRR